MGKGSGETMIRPSQRTVNRDRQYANMTPEERDYIRQMDDENPPGDGIYPEGRAPHGRGKEYADRRWISKTISTLKTRRSKLRATVANYRGQKNKAYEIERAKQRIYVYDTLIPDMEKIANDPKADWDFKRELIADLKEMTKEGNY